MKIQCPECGASFDPDAQIGAGFDEDPQCPVCGAVVAEQGPELSLPDFDLGQDLDDDFTAARPSDQGELDDPFGGIEVGFLDDLAAEDVSAPAVAVAPSPPSPPRSVPGDDAAQPGSGSAEPPARRAFAMAADGPQTEPAPEPTAVWPRPKAAPLPDDGRDIGFDRRAAHEISGLSELDLSMIGTYSRTQRSLDAAQDVVWSGPESRRGRDEAPRGARADEDGKRGERPRSSSEPSEAPRPAARRPAVDLESPFGAPPDAGPSGRSAEPSGAPRGRAEPAPGPAAERDPFGLDDPFARPPSSRAAARPAADDIFGDLLGDEPAPPPRARQDAPARGDGIDLGLDEVDFSALLDGEPSTHGVDAPAPKAPQRTARERKAAADPFAHREDTNTFFIEAPSMAGFSDGAGGGEAAGDGDLFDLDTPASKPSGGAKGARAAAKDEKGAKGKAPKGKKSRGAPLPSKVIQVKSAGGGRALKLGAVALLLVAAAGVGPELAGLGWFGLGTAGKSSKPPLPPTGPRGASPAVAVPAGHYQQPVEDTTRAYRDRIDALEKQLKGAPGDDATKRQLLAYYLEYSNRFPVNFQGDERYRKRLDELSKQLGDDKDLRVKAQLLMKQGKFEEAQAALDQYVASAAADPDILAFYGEVALRRGTPDKALEYFRKSTELMPAYARGHYFTGQVYEQMGDTERAGAAYKAAVDASPAHTQARLGMARVQLASRQADAAIASATEVLTAAQKEANTEDQFQAHLLLAKAWAAKSDTDNRISHLEAASQIRPDDEGAALDLVDLYAESGALDKAEERLLACEKRGCASARFYQAAVGFYMDRRRSIDDAERFAQGATEKLPDDPQILFLQAEVASARRLRKNARSLYQSVIDKSPGYVDAYSRLAEIYAEEQRYDQAARILEQGIQNAPSSTVLLTQLAEMMVATGQRMKAKDAFKELVAKDPSNVLVRTRLASLLGELGFAKEAIEQYDVLKSQGALDEISTLDYADVLARAGHHKKAIAELEAVLTADPQSVEANARLGAMFAAIQSYATARKYLELALKINPGYAPAFFELGRVALELGDADLAITQLQKAVAASPRDASYRHALANALVEKGGATNRRLALTQYDAIIKEYEGAPAGAKRNPEVYLKRGGLLFDAGKYREALSDFEQGMLIDSGRLTAIVSYAETLYKLKKEREAESYFREILGKEPNNATASYYLGKIALQKGQKQSAMDYFTAAVRGGGSEFPDAHKTLGYMYREKNMMALARREFELYLKTADASAYDREEVERLLGRLR